MYDSRVNNDHVTYYVNQCELNCNAICSTNMGINDSQKRDWCGDSFKAFVFLLESQNHGGNFHWNSVYLPQEGGRSGCRGNASVKQGKLYTSKACQNLLPCRSLDYNNKIKVVCREPIINCSAERFHVLYAPEWRHSSVNWLFVCKNLPVHIWPENKCLS